MLVFPCSNHVCFARLDSHTSFYVAWLVTQRKKRIGTFSRRTLLSIKLVQEKTSFWANIELSRRRKGGFTFSSRIGKGKVKKRNRTKETNVAKLRNHSETGREILSKLERTYLIPNGMPS